MSSRRSQQKKPETNWIYSFQVVQPTQHKKGFTVYKVISKVFQRGHPEGVTTIKAWKRYNDFKKLFKELQLIHHQLHLFDTFPTFPKGALFGRFENDIIEERRQAALTLLQFAALHPQLCTSKVFSKFLEAGSGYSDDELVDPPSDANINPSHLEDYLTKPCLVPQKLWAPPSNDIEEDDDKTSTSSIESSLLEASPLSPPHHSGPSSMIETRPILNPPEQHGPSTKCQPSELPSDAEVVDSREIPTISISQSWENIPDCHNDIHLESGISSSASCSSLDTQVPAMSAEDTEQTDQNPDVTKTPVKKSTSFGFFDFLPIFPKKAKEKHLSDEKLLSDSLTSSYICEAAGHFAVAQQFESCGEFPRAFSSYKAGIKILLTGVQSDDNPKRKRLVRSKLEKYIARAESLHDKSSSAARNATNDDPSPVNYSSLPVSSPTKVKNLYSNPTATSSPLDDLKEYKFIKIVHKRIYIVVSVKEDASPKCSVIKVLPKSLDVVDTASSPLMSKKLPFLISLQKWFETQHSYILLLEYASGGRLSDFVHNFQTKQIIIPKFDPDTDEGTAEDENENKDHEVESQKAASCIAALSELGSRTSPRTETGKELDKDSSINKEQPKNASEFNGTPQHDESNTTDIPLPDFESARQDREDVEALLRLNSLSLDNLKDIDTQYLIQNSKFLLETVSQTLAQAEADEVLVTEKLKEAEFRLNQGQSNRRQPSPSPTNMKVNPDFEANNKVDDNTSARFYQEENNNSKKPFERKNSRLTVFVDLQEGAGIKYETVQSGSPIKLRESSSAIDLTEVGTVGSPESPGNECINIKRMVPECCIKVWAAEIIMALENLHQVGLVYGELDMKNVLLGENGHILLSFKSNWFQQDQDYIPDKNDYSAPEVYNSFGQPLWKIHSSADFWSLGAILLELFTGQNARALHPEGFHEQTTLRIPATNLLGEPISLNVKSFLAELLQFNPNVRLGYYGAAELKTHPLFEGFDWDGATEAAILEKSFYNT